MFFYLSLFQSCLSAIGISKYMTNYLFFMFAVLTLTSCSALVGKDQNPIHVEINKVLNKVSHESEKKFNMKTIATCIGSPDWVLDHLSIDFEINKPLTKEQIKQICVFVGTHLRDEANGNPVLSKAMKTFPFTIINVGTTIFIHNKDGSDIYYPDYCIGKLFQGKFYFRSKDPTQQFGYKTDEEEPFTE